MDQTQDSIQASIEDSQLWEKFAALTNEMILTKTGRCMFPLIKLVLSGLDPNGLYKILLQFRQIGDNRYKYVNGEWRSGQNSVQIMEIHVLRSKELFSDLLETKVRVPCSSGNPGGVSKIWALQAIPQHARDP